MSSEVERGRDGPRHRGVGTRSADLPYEGDMPAFEGASAWLNSKPLTPAALRGKVVLVQFWTYTCINWLRTHPYVRAWAARYRDHGLAVIGVHTPEFRFEHELDNIRQAAASMRVDWPIAVDNDYAVWQAFANHYWPALYFVDAQGHMRHHRFGEGDYERSEMVIQQLLAEAGISDVPEGLAEIQPEGAELAADWVDLRSAENYLGYDRTENLEVPGGLVADVAHVYTAPGRLALNHWAPTGAWTVRSDAIVLNEPRGRIAYQFHARDLHLVMGPSNRAAPVRFRVTLEGKAPGPAHGVDVDGEGNGTVADQRMYQLIRQPKQISDRRFEIEFLDAGAEALVFTFG